MAVQILSQSYGPRKPLIECTADSLSELAGLVCAEGSTATVGGTEYVLDRVNGWVEPGSGGGGGSGVLVVNATGDETLTLDKTWQEIHDAMPLVVLSYAAQGLVGFVTMVGYRDGVYLAQFGNVFNFGAANPNDYPIDPYDGGGDT